ncbi:glycosyltransferase family 2 protein, partial [Methanobrevibacter sp.]|uniref:glycosyltransferase family 2 protein n=1 Tax=Methanobrevibacter sp. TaxID=66852 RepID=UPI0026E05E2A
MTKKNISIIIPVYNSEKYLSKTFESLLNQTIGFENLEIIFVDDNSKDNSGEIIDNYSKEYGNVISVHLKENSGYAGRPRNIGMEKSNSEYLMFLDSDDYFNEDACEILYSKINKNPDIDMVLGGYSNISSNSKKDKHIRKNQQKTLYKDGKNDYVLLTTPPSISSKIFRKKLLIENDIKFPEGIPAQDLVFVCKAICCSNLILSLNKYLVYNRRLREDPNNLSVTQNIEIPYILKSMKAYRLLIDICEKFDINKNCAYGLLSDHYSFLTVQLNKSGISEKEYNDIFESEEYAFLKNHSYYKNEKPFNLYFKILEANISDGLDYMQLIKKFYIAQ